MYNEMLCKTLGALVTTWQQIWQTVHHKLGNRPKRPRSPLSDPPAIKELLKSEIQLLLGTDGGGFEWSCSRSSVSSTTSQDDIDDMKHKLNVNHIEDVVAHLNQSQASGAPYPTRPGGECKHCACLGGELGERRWRAEGGGQPALSSLHPRTEQKPPL
ncbi:unnamed protein product [Coregonus sp. 'balchen']|nr:unnamed protein product [Coregonus sp. 'balchen']